VGAGDGADGAPEPEIGASGPSLQAIGAIHEQPADGATADVAASSSVEAGGHSSRENRRPRVAIEAWEGSGSTATIVGGMGRVGNGRSCSGAMGVFECEYVCDSRT